MFRLYVLTLVFTMAFGGICGAQTPDPLGEELNEEFIDDVLASFGIGTEEPEEIILPEYPTPTVGGENPEDALEILGGGLIDEYGDEIIDEVLETLGIDEEALDELADLFEDPFVIAGIGIIGEELADDIITALENEIGVIGTDIVDDILGIDTQIDGDIIDSIPLPDIDFEIGIYDIEIGLEIFLNDDNEPDGVGVNVTIEY